MDRGEAFGIDGAGIGFERDLEIAGRTPRFARAAAMIAAVVSGSISDGVPPPKKMLVRMRSGVRAAKCASSASNAWRQALLVDALDDMAVEIAIGTLRQTERPVHIQAETFVALVPCQVMRNTRPPTAGKPSARWLMACLAGGSISAKVISKPSAMKIGS